MNNKINDLINEKTTISIKEQIGSLLFDFISLKSKVEVLEVALNRVNVENELLKKQIEDGKKWKNYFLY